MFWLLVTNGSALINQIVILSVHPMHHTANPVMQCIRLLTPTQNKFTFYPLIIDRKSCASLSHLWSLLLYLVAPKAHVKGDESKEYNFNWWTVVKANHSVQIQWSYWPPMVHRKQGFRLTHFAISSGLCAKSLRGSKSSGCCRAKTGSCSDTTLGNYFGFHPHFDFLTVSTPASIRNWCIIHKLDTEFQ